MEEIQLKDFIEHALVNIAQGVRTANEKLKPSENTTNKVYSLRSNIGTGDKAISGVLFDVAVTAIKNSGDLLTASNCMQFNGDDQIALYKSGTMIDKVGMPGDIDFGKDVTLVRKNLIYSPCTTYSSDDWYEYPKDTFDYLGAHIFGDIVFLETPVILEPSSITAYETYATYITVSGTCGTTGDTVYVYLGGNLILTDTDGASVWSFSIGSDSTPALAVNDYNTFTVVAQDSVTLTNYSDSANLTIFVDTAPPVMVENILITGDTQFMDLKPTIHFAQFIDSSSILFYEIYYDTNLDFQNYCFDTTVTNTFTPQDNLSYEKWYIRISAVDKFNNKSD